MKTLIEEHPNLRNELKKIIESPEAMYRYNKTESLVSIFTKALELDPEIDPDDIEMIVTTIPTWLEYPMIVDYFSDAARSEFEKTVLKDYPLVVAQLNKNRLRVSQLRVIDTFLQMNDSLFVNENTKKLWQKYIAIVKQDKKVCIEEQPILKSTYEIDYDIEARISYITKMTVIVNAICCEYVDSKIQR